ncbi:MAG: glycosyltransferase family 32 protein [Thermoleophilaceae bacterium]
MPERFESYGESWRRHHPDWEMRLWTDSNLPHLRFPDAVERGRNPGERSDLVRYEVLVHFGGVYVDTDMESLRSIEALIAEADAFAGAVRAGKLGNAILGCAPGHPAFGRLLEEASGRSGSGHVSGATGPRLVTEVLTASGDVTIFPPEAFYHFHHRRSPTKDAETPGAYAIHHVDASWKTADDLREDIRRLRNRLDRADARNQRLRRSRRRLGRRAKKARLRRRTLSRRRDRVGRRLATIERSSWWRLRARLAPVVGRALARVRAARGLRRGPWRGR